MSTLRSALRKITFPFTPNTFVNVTTVTDYLVYTLPYSTNILLYNDIDNPLVTRTFRPKEIFLASEILVTDTSSPNYNYPVIQEYVTKGIFSKLPLSTTSSVGAPGIAADPSVFNVETIHTMVPENLGTPSLFSQTSAYKRDSLITWVARYNATGSNEVPRIYTFNLIDNLLDYYDIEFDAGQNYYYSSTNPVLDSSGIPWVLFETPNVGTPANYDYHLTTYNSGAGTINMKQVPGGSNTIVLSNQVNGLPFNTLLIDANDNIYLCTYATMYKVVASVLTPIFSSPNGEDMRQAEYRIATNTFIVKSNQRKLYELAINGDIIQETQSMLDFAQDFATGGYLAQVLTVAQDGPVDFNVMPFFDENINAARRLNSNSNNTMRGFVDGDQNTAELTNFDSLVLNYDISDTDIYFVDGLNNIGV